MIIMHNGQKCPRITKRNSFTTTTTTIGTKRFSTTRTCFFQISIDPVAKYYGNWKIIRNGICLVFFFLVFGWSCCRLFSIYGVTQNILLNAFEATFLNFYTLFHIRLRVESCFPTRIVQITVVQVSKYVLHVILRHLGIVFGVWVIFVTNYLGMELFFNI